jgi:hypothetical protein
MPATVTDLGGGGDWVPGAPDDTQQATPVPTRSVVTPLGGSSDWKPQAPYPDMTPGPPSKGILETSYHSLPSDTRPGGSIVDAASRVAAEMSDAAANTPDILTPAAIKGAGENLGWLGRNVVGPIAQGVNYVGSGIARELSALGAGGMAGLSEIASGGNPELARDIHAGLTVAPVAATMTPGFVPPATPKAEPLGPFQMQAKPVTTPSEALQVVKPMFKAADASDVRLDPQFTNDWVSSLDNYQPQSPAGAASASAEHPVTKLVDQLRQTANAPMDTIGSIQDVDQNIQKAISANLGDPETAGQMRQILRDFRDRYSNIPSDQFTGNPQDIQTFNDARRGYAAYSRMNEIQGIVDSTEGNANRASLISSRINSFLNKPENIAGWNPDEIAAARQTADTGFLPEWLRAGGSRLVAIGAGAAHGLMGGLPAMTADVAASYLLRNTAEGMRLRQAGQLMQLLGQRVPQPGTVPAPPAAGSPGLLTQAARYAPFTGLLGQQDATQ